MSETRSSHSLIALAAHLAAAATVVATVALLALGAIVTTFRVGMADPVWPTSPWHLLYVYDEPSPGFLIEHTHRLAGYIVGCCVIGLAVLVTVSELCSTGKPRVGVIGLGWAVLLCVIIQGLLGGFRVRLHALVGTDLAAIHGIFAQVVFSMIVSVAVLTWPFATRAAPLDASEAKSLRRLAMTLTACLFLQLVWGSLTRHTHHPLAQRLHFLTAFAVLAAIAWFVKAVWESPVARRRLGIAAVLLSGLVVFQLLLGVEAWLARFGTGELPDMQHVTPSQAVIRTAHVLIGSWLLALSVSCTLLARAPRHAPVEVARTLPATGVHLTEGAA